MRAPGHLLRSPALRRAAARGFVIVLLVLAILGALGSVALSPALMNRFGPVGTPETQAEWQRLSNIGQTYGAASALLSVLALLGVAVSLVMQARESRAAREQARRALHFELLRMAMDDPFYLAVWGPFAPSDKDLYREHMYANLIVSHWQTDWDVGTLDEEHLREISAVFFQGPAGHRFWGNTRDMRLKAERRHRKRGRFIRILDDEWRKVNSPMASPSPVDDEAANLASSTESAPGDPRTGLRIAVAVLGGTALGVVVTGLLGRRRRTAKGR